MIGVGDKPCQPAQDERNAADVARCIRWVVLYVCNCLAVIPLIGNEWGGKFTMCLSTITTLENAKLVLYLVSLRIYSLPAASSPDEQISLAARAGKDLLRNNYNEIALVLFLKS